jgi:ariadne-1
MEEMQRTSNLSWIEVQFLRVAVDKLFECRMTLKWTYAFAFYLERDNQTALFEDNQRDLEMAVEALSELLEQPIDPNIIKELKQNVLNKTSYVAKRRETLLEDTAHGLMEDRWKYQVTL